MDWTILAPAGSAVIAAFLGLIGLLFQARKNHHAAMEQIEANKNQSDAQIEANKKQAAIALKQAEAALEASRASATTAEATAESMVQDAFTRAYDAASKNWAHSQESLQKWCESQATELSRLSERQSKTEMALEAEKVRANKYEHLYALAIVYLHRVFGWVAEHLPGEDLPPPPPEIELDLSYETDKRRGFSPLITEVGRAARERAEEERDG